MSSSHGPPPLTIGRQTVALTVALATSQVAIATAYIVAARGTTPAAFGSAVVVISVGLVAAGIFDFGSNALAIREIAKGAMPIGEFRGRALIKLVLAIVVGLVATAIELSWPGSRAGWLAAAPVALAMIATQTAQVPLRANARGVQVAVVVALDRAVVLSIVVLVARAGGPAAEWLWVAMVAGSITSGVAAWLLGARLQSTENREAMTFVSPWKGSGHFGLAGAFVSGQGLDVSVTGLAAGPAAAGVYGAVNRWTAPMGLLSTAFTQASVPFVSRAESGARAVADMRRHAWILLLAIASCVVVALAAAPFVDFVMGDAYAGSALVLAVMAVGTIPAIINQPLAMFHQSRGNERFVARTIGGAVVVQMMLILVLAAAVGAVGAAWAFLIAQTALLAVLAVILFRTGVHR